MKTEYDALQIPAYITVHLRPPDSNAENVTVSFVDYIKGVVSATLPSGLPEETAKAIIIAQSTLALKRIEDGYYRNENYPFDITNDEGFDQGYVYQGGIDMEYSILVDEYFTYYVAKKASAEPMDLRICYTTNERCRGISLNESIELALNGYSAEQIIEYFYGKNIYIEENAVVFGLETDGLLTYPMVLGDRGKNVSGLQIALNRIAANYTSISRIDDIDGIYGRTTFDAVSEFQRAFDMQDSGMVDRATFHRLSYIYDNIRNLSELVDVGEEFADIPINLRADLEYGSVGNAVKLLQYYLLFVSAFDSRIPKLDVIGVFGEKTYQAVVAFQKAFGFEPDGVVTKDVWNVLLDVYEGLYAALPPSAFSQTAIEYFGNILLLGSEGREVRYLQEYLKTVAERYEEIPPVVVNGYFDKQTEGAVKAFQKLFGIRESGVVSSTTWRMLSQIYNAVMGG